MPQLPIAEWQASLAGMEAALAETLAALDRYQAGWSGVLATPDADARPDRLADRLGNQLQEWDARLTAAAELAESVEKQLNEQDRAVAHWQEQVTNWREQVHKKAV